MSRQLAPGAVAYFRARFKGVSGEYWARATSVTNGQAALDMPSAGFSQYKTILGADVLDVVMDLEEIATSGNATLRASFGVNAAFGRFPSLLGGCGVPDGAAPPLYVSCDDAHLTRIVDATSGPNSRIGIVLVHGWSLNVGSPNDYLDAQGLVCTEGTQTAHSTPTGICTSWSTPPSPKVDRPLPGVAYFQNLRSLLFPQAELAGRFGGAPLYVFDYQSYNTFNQSGQQLADKLRALSEVDGVVIVGHSMGGLVARQAARFLESQAPQLPQRIVGIITLGTPHEGSPLPSLPLIGGIWKGIDTPGGQSLLSPGLARNELTPLIAYGGNIAGFSEELRHLDYYPSYWALAANPFLRDNDGVVPVHSALPTSFAGRGAVTLRGPFMGYDHSDMTFKGEKPDDPQGLRSDLQADLTQLLRRKGATRLDFATQPVAGVVGSELAPIRISVRDDHTSWVNPPTVQVTVSLGSNPTGATFSGSTTAPTIGGIATFSDLTIDRAGSYNLVASAVGLNATSTSFTIATPPQIPTISPTPSTISFSATAGGILPLGETVTLSNSGGGTLTGLAVGTVTYEPSQTPGWLGTPSLSSGTPPSTLTLRPNTTALPAGSYNAVVQVGASGGVSSIGLPVTYVISNATLLPAPTLTAPSLGANGVSITPTFNWTPVSGANRYWLLVANSPSAFPTDPNAASCPGCVVSGVTNATSHTLPAAFPNSTGGGSHPTLNARTLYYWKVQAFNGISSPNIQGLYPAASTFTTEEATGPTIGLSASTATFNATAGGASPSPQNAIVLSNIGTGALSGLSLGSISYQAGQTPGWLSASLSGSMTPATLSLTATTGTLVPGSYTATVPINSTAPGVSNSGTVVTVTFFIAPAVPLEPPVIMGPGASDAAGPTLSALSPTFTWSAVAGATSYGLYIRNLATNALTTIPGLTGTSYQLPGGYLLNGYPYRWAMTSFSGVTESSTQSSYLFFRTPAAVPVPPPTITSPGSVTAPGPTLSTLAPTFSWGTVAGATTYALYIRNLGTNALLTVTGLTGNSYSLPAGTLQAGYQYRWAMTSFAGATESGAQSSYLFFAINAGAALPPPTTISPGTTSAPGPALTSLTPTLTWAAVPGATAYRLYLYDLTMNFQFTFDNLSGTAYTIPASYLFAGREYRWGMTSLNGATESSTQSGMRYFTAPAASGSFRIQVRFLTTGGGQSPSASQAMVFSRAVSRLERAITRPLGPVPIAAGFGTCGGNSPAIDEVVDALVIFVTIRDVDGPNGTLGTGGPCFVRGGSSLPIIGTVTLDRADLGWLETGGQLENVILHEMIHVLGFGTVWGPNFLNLLVNPSLPSSPGADTYFSGASAIAGFTEIGGAAYTGGSRVPVENTASTALGAAADSHWRTSVLGLEIMNPFVIPGVPNFLSRLTLRSLQDLGYSIDMSQADVFSIAPTLRESAARNSSPAILLDDVARIPIYVVDSRGRMIRVIEPLLQRSRPRQ